MSPAAIGCLLAAMSDECLSKTRDVVLVMPHPDLRDEVIALLDSEQGIRNRIYEAIHQVEGQS